MKNFQIVLLSTALCLGCGGLVAAQEQAPAPEAPQPQNTQPEATTESWIEQLGSDSYRKRLAAERRLREIGKDAVPALQKAAEQHADGEVQWRARRLLRQIDNGALPGLVERARTGGPASPESPSSPLDRTGRPQMSRELDAMRRQFDHLFEHFERDLGLDVPRMRFFENDFFRDLEAQLQMPSGGANSKGMTMQVGPDGVRVEVQETGKDGKAETKVYEAPDLESFRQQYPDVLRDSGLGFGGRVFGGLGLDPLGNGLRGHLRGRFGPLTRGFEWSDARPLVVPFPQAGQNGADGADPQAPSLEVPAVPPAGRRLGVTVRDIPAGVRDYLQLDADEGLMVESVQPGTLAAALKLQQNDIVVRIGDARIGSPADVQRALGAIDKGQPVEVEFVRRGRVEQAVADKTESSEPVRQQLEPRRSKGDTIR